MWAAVRQLGPSKKAVEAATEQVQMARDERLAADSRQARLITSQLLTGVATQPGSALFEVHNASAEPVRALKIVGAWAPSHTVCAAKGFYATAFVPDGDYDGLPLTMWGGLLPAGTTVQVEVAFYADQRRTPLTLDMDDTGYDPSINITFVDAVGVRWERWGLVDPVRSETPTVMRTPPPHQRNTRTRPGCDHAA
ncbi:hypothetical protein [Branchiibius cervicis]|uniref:Lamin tail domain-containing protein n=1 Tax=Branchiibius cervicis TaxID=908252 RepID=A0ABW2AVJ0_9MICO